MASAQAIKAALIAVIRQRQHAPPQYIHNLDPTPEEEREILEDILISSNEPWREDVLRAIDRVYAMESPKRPVTVYSDIPALRKSGRTSLAVWKGDITELKVDAIVNAANSAGLGCFQPKHRCIDNIIHCYAGPRLRMACKQLMEERGSPLAAGTEPIITDAYFLPSSMIIHVTGPQLENQMTEQDQVYLQRTYINILEAAMKSNARTVAICCISTGVFGFPSAEAAKIATRTVIKWLETHPNQFESIIFNTFSNSDEASYKQLLCNMDSLSSPCASSECQQAADIRDMKLSTAKKWIDEADAILICAGSGMSVNDGYNVYTNREDFAKYYPWMLRWGYNTCYETMGLSSDPQVPNEVKWAQFAKHMDNMRWNFPPNQGYQYLKELIGDKDHFVLTSNVEAMFERSGFDKDRIYTPQGEWTYYQCMDACRDDSVFESRPLLDRIIPLVGQTGTMPSDAVPSCPRCGGGTFPNVRAGSNFLHCKYDEQNDKIRRWMQSQIEQKKKVVAIEIGAGFNTPMVTRMPTESFVAASGGSLIRINPSDMEIPRNTQAISIAEGWEVIEDILEAPNKDHYETISKLQEGILLGDLSRVIEYFGHFDWDQFLSSLKG